MALTKSPFWHVFLPFFVLCCPPTTPRQSPRGTMVVALLLAAVPQPLPEGCFIPMNLKATPKGEHTKGSWRVWGLCAAGEFAVEMQQRFDPGGNWGPGSGLNAVKMKCTDGEIIWSHDGFYGDWGKWIHALAGLPLTALPSRTTTTPPPMLCGCTAGPRLLPTRMLAAVIGRIKSLARLEVRSAASECDSRMIKAR